MTLTLHAHDKQSRIEGTTNMAAIKRECRHCGRDLTFVTYRDTIDGFGCFPCELARDHEFRRRILETPYAR